MRRGKNHTSWQPGDRRLMSLKQHSDLEEFEDDLERPRLIQVLPSCWAWQGTWELGVGVTRGGWIGTSHPCTAELAESLEAQDPALTATSWQSTDTLLQAPCNLDHLKVLFPTIKLSLMTVCYKLPKNFIRPLSCTLYMMKPRML